ncbi:VOC family protein [Bacteriovorax stolpii]|uniref:Glyoxalase n=1 Tax=Bacteriovorax stolpii TaxID=960 RepID=A0A2K9NU51_BACTC|nr:VOC family protein [Bacteriovorax stolpii]AUN98615.1 glyoxalase [Bacteriovorax stolpii]QDK41405.1 VOC family protein [Bacteriovorax stolpii]TDP55879.1 putative glyoxalase superfamily protein PhnB [Bacteriovorax stolpii]
MKLGYVIYYVESVEATIAFYENAFGFSRKFVHESGEYGELATGETTLSFASLNMAEMNGIGFTGRAKDFKSAEMEIGLVTSDVLAAHKKAVSAGATEVKEPTQKPWGQTVSYVRDPNGFLIEICSPIG